MSNKDSNTLLLIKPSANFIALWLTSLFLGVPILFLIQYPNPIFFAALIVGGIIFYYILYKETTKEKSAIHMMEDKLELKNTVVQYEQIEYFQFIAYKVDKKMVIDIHWWTPRILQLHIKTIKGEKLWNCIPNKMGDFEEVKQRIRDVFISKNVLEKEENQR